MRTVFHRAVDRGAAEHGWLKSRYSFSFADWFSADRLGFGALRVLNDDKIAPGSGFPMHSHANMEIVTIVTRGAVTHEDSMGNSAVVRAGDAQVMSAGTGIVHSEFNRSVDEPLELFQIWVTPRASGGRPSYAQASFADATPGTFRLIASPTGEGDSLPIRQDAFVWRGMFETETPVEYHPRRTGNGVYLFVISGGARLGEDTLEVRDAVGVWDADTISFLADARSDILLFDVLLSATG